ncbi:MAG TPA: thioredoxin family protein [Bacillota bacterium]|nr:MAG: hypothetical protein BWY00_00480 [Firmicutes bacterium ADurb.Bin153]HNV34199.1 thioredoxin family protein [Bacillota bacterium]HPU95541.1 thioredoxin family protein [Bacillota bacterium]
MVIKVLGTGCRSCATLEDNVRKAVSEKGLAAEIIKVTDIEQIVSYGVMSMPALVVDDKVVSYGKVLTKEDVARILDKIS